MPEYPSQKIQREYYEFFREHISQWDWQWHASLTFLPDTTFQSARQRFKQWRLNLINEERLQIGIFYIVSHKREHKHIHALMIGRNRNGKTLLDCSSQRWQNDWKDVYKEYQPFSNYTSKIEKVYDNEGICDYVTLHFLGFKSDWLEYDHYGERLLQQEKIPNIEGDYNVHIL